MDKICTSLVQSYKLLELKFDASTADMCWATELFGEPLPSWRVLCVSSEEYRNSEGKSAIPAWSLSALTELVISGLKSSDIRLNFCKAEKLTYENKHIYHIRCTFDRVANGLHTWRDGRYTIMHEELLDAMFELVCSMRKESLL